MSVSDRLGRLLFIVPYVLHRDGVLTDELAQLLGVSKQQIEADVVLLSMVGRPPLTPDHLVDLYIEDDVVYVELDQSLTRPLRLTHDEARALVLGAKLVGHLGGWGSDLTQLLARIMEHLNPVDRESVLALSERVVMQGGKPASHEAAALLREAALMHRVVRMCYYSATSDALKTYQLKPLGLLTHGGVDYVVALDGDAQDREKLFRMDRVGDVTLAEATFEPPQGFDLEKFRTQKLYCGGDTLQATVRFSQAVARDVAERFSPQDVTEHVSDAGAKSLDVRVATSSAGWLARWVLSFGVHAEVLGPEVCRAHVRAVCAEAAAAYRKPVTGTLPDLPDVPSPRVNASTSATAVRTVS